jgi:hypothetical protein
VLVPKKVVRAVAEAPNPPALPMLSRREGEECQRNIRPVGGG